jgi:hypothetical protein
VTHPDPPAGAQCRERPALLPVRLQPMVPYGESCRNCLMEMYRCSIGALLEEAGGPRESEIPHGFREGIAEFELLRTEAALQKPEPNTEKELKDRWSSLHRERLRALGTWRC